MHERRRCRTEATDLPDEPRHLKLAAAVAHAARLLSARTTSESRHARAANFDQGLRVGEARNEKAADLLVFSEQRRALGRVLFQRLLVENGTQELFGGLVHEASSSVSAYRYRGDRWREYS